MLKLRLPGPGGASNGAGCLGPGLGREVLPELCDESGLGGMGESWGREENDPWPGSPSREG